MRMRKMKPAAQHALLILSVSSIYVFMGGVCVFYISFVYDV